MPDRAVPNLPSRDFEVTIAFYGAFGFEVDYRDDGWLSLRRGPIELDFFLFPDLVPEESSYMCSVRVDDVDDLHRSIRAAGVADATAGMPRLTPVELRRWGRRAAFLIDPDGTQLHLMQNPA